MQSPLDFAKIRVVAEHLSCKLGGEAVILHLKTSQYYGLNSVAADVWDLLQTCPRTKMELISALESAYDAPVRQLEADIDDLLHKFHKAGLITFEADARPSVH